jgi:hypothetical protein
MNLAIAGTARLVVMEARNPQIASPKTMPIKIRPIHVLESAGDNSGAATCRVSFMAWHPSLIVTHLRVILEEGKRRRFDSRVAPDVEVSRYHLLTGRVDTESRRVRK